MGIFDNAEELARKEKLRKLEDKRLAFSQELEKQGFAPEKMLFAQSDKGGFVAFCRDREVEDVRSDIRSIAGAVDAAGYSVSLGAACQDKPALELHSLVREAESYMYKEKQQYYEQSAHDRRKRPLKA